VYLKRAALQDNRTAQYMLGHMYETGKGVKKCSWSRAVKWYKLAADAGDSEAQTALALCYMDPTGSKGVSTDLSAAVSLLTQSAANHNPRAHCFLGG